MTTDTFATLPLGSIVTSPTNPRKSFNPLKLTELTESIRLSGVHQPILVRPLPGARVADTDRVSMMFNIGMIRAEAIDTLLVETMQRGQMAFVRMQARYRRGLPLGFDAQGLHDVPEAIDVYEVMVDHSSPQQMIDCIKAAYARISNGEILQVVA